MKRKSALILFSCLFLAAAASPPKPPAKIPSIEPFSKTDRVLVLAPHPDDEVIGCAGVIQEAVKAKAAVRVAYLTNGEHNEFAFIVYEKRITLRQKEFIHLGQVRRSESIKSMELLGLKENDLIFLGYPDFGTFTIFSRYWQTDRPYSTLLTRISSVPYKQNLSFRAPYVGESILNDIKKVLREFKPNKIFVTHPADTNGDHRAFYLFLQVALRDLRKEMPMPIVRPYLVHCVGWPLPRHYHPQLKLQPPDKFINSEMSWLQFSLTTQQLEKKHEAILAHKSQTRSSAFYLLAFIRSNELFSDYPEIELMPQEAVRPQVLRFSGFSDMYADIGDEAETPDEGKIKDAGRVGFATADKSLYIRIEKEKEMGNRFGFIIYLFGYNDRIPFSQMPKIRVIAKGKKFKILSGRKVISPQGVTLQKNSTELILKVPLDVLGSPDFILTSMKGYGGRLPADAIAFRKIRIK